MGPMDDLVNTALRYMETEKLVEELNSRYDEVELSGVKYRISQQIQSEAENSPLSISEIKNELAKAWLGDNYE